MTEEEATTCETKPRMNRITRIAIFAVIGALAGFLMGNIAAGTALGAAGGVILGGGG
jgi:hypothetical protein|tara:strand:+ start:37 stop:207 length:171 start_codon:yes stop_codon:yes gene_type:complete